MTYDIVGVGEAMLRLWVPAGERLEHATRLRVSVGGSEANVAVAAARMGAKTAWLSVLPDNALGRRAAAEIAAHGVDVSHVRWVDGGRMGTYFAELSVPPRPPFVIYDRAGSAAATTMDATSIDWEAVESARIVHLSGITPALSPSCRDLSHEIVARGRAAGALVSLDVNYRAKLWPAPECRATVEPLAADADLVIVTAEDAHDVFGTTGSAADAADALAASLGPGTVVVTDGAAGASWTAAGERGSLPGYPEAVTVDRVGAGDAFAAGVLVGVLEDDLARGVARGLAMAALSLGIYGDQLTATRDEVDRLLERSGREMHR